MALIGFGMLVTVWEILGMTHVIGPAFFDSAPDIFGAVLRSLLLKKTWIDIWSTLYKTALGLSVAAMLGIPVGVLIGYSDRLRTMLEAPLDFLRSIPATGLLPLFILLVGIKDGSKIALVAFASTLVITIYTMLGVRNMKPAKQRFAESLRASRFDILTKVVFFEALPSTVAGLRVSASLSLVLVIVVEMVMPGETGLGYRISNARYTARYTEMYAFIVICGLIGYSMNKACEALGHRFIHWSRH